MNKYLISLTATLLLLTACNNASNKKQENTPKEEEKFSLIGKTYTRTYTGSTGLLISVVCFFFVGLYL